MPIAREQFDEGLDDVDNAILKVLRATPDQAFTEGETLDKVNTLIKPPVSKSDFVALIRFSLRFPVLVNRGLIEHKALGFTDYYVIRRQ